jgi:hypothetical protein
MSAAADVMAVVLFAFFLVGIVVGVIVVIALSVRKTGRRYRPDRAARDEWPYQPPDPGSRPDDDEPGRSPGPPWWQPRDGD